MIRTVNTEDIVKNIKEMCIEANHYLSKDMDKALKDGPSRRPSRRRNRPSGDRGR